MTLGQVESRSTTRHHPARRSRARTGWILLALLAGAAIVRGGLIALGWPTSNSDEATIGLMALHIAEGRHLPVFFYGQSYMGPVQAYVGAGVFTVLEPSVAALRTGLLLLFIGFLALVFTLARRLYDTRVALIAVGLLALGSRESFGNQLVAIGGLPETLVAGTGLLLLGHRALARADDPDDRPGRIALGGWAALAALGLWNTLLVAPFVGGSALLVWRAWRRGRAAGLPRRAPAAALAVGLLLGASPVLAHDLTRPVRDGWIATNVRLYDAGGSGQRPGDAGSLAHRVVTTVGTSLAHATGGAGLAHHDEAPAWPTGWSGSRPATGPAAADAVWGIALVALWVAALAGTVRRMRRRAPAGARQEARLWGRVAVLACAGLTVGAFAASPAPGLSPAHHARYLVGVLVAAPAVVHVLGRLRWPRAWGAARRSGPPPGRLILLAAAAVLLVGTAGAYRDAGRSSGDRPVRDLARALVGRDLTRVYADYWTCNRLTFTSREDVRCAVVDRKPDGFHHGLDRYRPYRAEVLADGGAAYVFATGGADSRAVPTLTGCSWRERWQVAGYDVWVPTGPCPPVAGPDR